ncbi:energy transducer TonB [Chryseobacterium antibioticum]|uniref:Energy transducer TonB n=1 Tax=Chryseobacterium pyrolae TaxID=2987481 RepID=A0ABT2II97_9FLAO|nr:energy transducer TonB [Chryseobacterium pyrolae]MCT2408373.1 energy transducer TonB [Chryseobacterium pyrolae]
MKKYLLLLPLLFIGIKGFSQQAPKTEVTAYTQKAEFPGGDEAFRKQFMDMLHAYVDAQSYAINGKVTFVINIAPNGKMDRLDILPKIKNSEMFVDDVKYAMKKIKGKWKPAMKDNTPVDSKMIVKVNFSTHGYDED